MANDKIFKQMKGIIYCMRDGNGNFRTLPIGYLGKKNIPEEKIVFLQNFIKLLLDTDFIHLETRMYLSDESITIKTVHSRLIDLPDYSNHKVSEKTIANKIYKDQSKVESIFGTSLIYDILYAAPSLVKERTLAYYSAILAEQFRKLEDYSDLTNQVLLNIPTNTICSTYSSDYDLFLEAIKPYLKSQVAAIESSLPKDGIGYFNYLLGTPELTGIDKEKKHELLSLFGKVENS